MALGVLCGGQAGAEEPANESEGQLDHTPFLQPSDGRSFLKSQFFFSLYRILLTKIMISCSPK